MRWLGLILAVGLGIVGDARAQSANCVTSDGAGPRQSGCFSADSAGGHLKVESAGAPRFDVTVGGHTAFVADPIGVTFAEPGAPAVSGFSPLITLNETNLATNDKHGLRGVLYTNNTTSTINANLLALDIFTPPDNGGDASGAYIRQTGGGNAMSLFNLCGERPKGFLAYCGKGFALEAQVDGAKHAVFASAAEGVVFLGVVRGESGTGLAVFPSHETTPNARAIHVADADNSRETFFVDMSGQVYARKIIKTEGGVAASNLDSSVPVFEAHASRQTAFEASIERGGDAFRAKQANDTATKGAALAVETAEGRDVARIEMNGAANFAALAIAGEAIQSPLRATSGLIGGKILGIGRCEETHLAVLGATPSMVVVVSPVRDPGDGFFSAGRVASSDEVVVKLCNSTGARATPVATAYNVRVLR